MNTVNKVNKIIFLKKDFDDKLYEKVSQQVQLLIETGNVCVIGATEDGVIIEYTSSNPLVSEEPYPCFLYLDEMAYIGRYIAEKALRKYEDEIDDLSLMLSEMNKTDTNEFVFKEKEKDEGDLN